MTDTHSRTIERNSTSARTAGNRKHDLLSHRQSTDEMNCALTSMCGGALVLWGLMRGNLGGMIHAAIGGLLIHRGMGGQCLMCGSTEEGNHPRPRHTASRNES